MSFHPPTSGHPSHKVTLLKPLQGKSCSENGLLCLAVSNHQKKTHVLFPAMFSVEPPIFFYDSGQITIIPKPELRGFLGVFPY